MKVNYLLVVHSIELSDSDVAYNWYSNIEVYINGSKTKGREGGGPEEITNSAVNYFWASDLRILICRIINKLK